MGLPVGEEFTLSVTTDKSKTARKADKFPMAASNWRNLRPVMTYADSDAYDSFVWFSKNSKGWVSGDPFAKETEAGNGKTPRQSAVVPELASQFLSADGNTWSAWRELPTVQADKATNTFKVRHNFEQSDATVALRYPFSYTYLQSLLERLRAAEKPGVTVEEIGVTAQDRKLQIIRVEPVAPVVRVGQAPRREQEIQTTQCATPFDCYCVKSEREKLGQKLALS